MEGIILKGIGGFYYVKSEGNIYECKAKGVFRNKGITPFAGDRVEFSPLPEDKGNIEKIFPRSNFLVRPPVANIDALFIVVSVCDPAPSTLLIDKTIAVAEDKGIEPVVVITKTDLMQPRELVDIYKKAGFKTVAFSSDTKVGAEEIKALLVGRISAFTGNTGVGKSSLINCVYPEFSQETGIISQKLGRGKHTTRCVELLELPDGGYVADTPGFASLDSEKSFFIRKENLQFCFREFKPFIDLCKFAPGCSHTKERSCAVIDAVERGVIPPSRHKSYVSMYEAVKNIRDWQIK